MNMKPVPWTMLCLTAISVATVVFHEDPWFPLVLWIFYGVFRGFRWMESKT